MREPWDHSTKVEAMPATTPKVADTAVPVADPTPTAKATVTTTTAPSQSATQLDTILVAGTLVIIAGVIAAHHARQAACERPSGPASAQMDKADLAAHHAVVKRQTRPWWTVLLPDMRGWAALG